MKDTTILTPVIEATSLSSRWRRIVIDASEVYPLLLPHFERQIEGKFLGAFHLWFYFPVTRADAVRMPRMTGKFAEMFEVDPSIYGDPDVEVLSRRMYTVRSVDGDWRHLELNFAVHDNDGRGSNWARQASAGSPLVMDTGGRVMDADEIPTDATLILLGDETVVPTVASMLERAPAGMKVFVCIEVADDEHEWTFETEADVTVEWIHRGDAEMGTTDFMIEYCDRFAWPDGPVYVFAGAEGRQVYALRKHLRETRGLSRDNYSLMGYWRRNASTDRILEVEANIVNDALASGGTMQASLAAHGRSGDDQLHKTPFEYMPVDTH